MSFAESKPKARAVEPISVIHKGERMVVLRDPLQLSDKSVTLSPAAYWVISHMNGENKIREIRENFEKVFGVKISFEEMESLMKILDEMFFLENENFENHRKSLISEFMKSAVRPSILAGKGYPDDMEEVSIHLDKFLDSHATPEKAPFAIVAPHIDLRAGGPTFGAAYARIRNSKAKTFVILAIGHMLSEDFFACIDKDFETPLGISPVDREFLNDLEKDFGEPIYEHAFAHKLEHSAEFQVLFLQKLFGSENPPRKIVPILLSFPENIDQLDFPMFNRARLQKFSEALRKGIERMGEDVCVIAGIDLSHVGRRFGQKEGAPPKLLEKMEQEDRQLLHMLAAGDKEGFMRLMKKINHKNHVCGFPAMYVLFNLLNNRRGELIEYRQNLEGDNDSVVSFAAMAF